MTAPQRLDVVIVNWNTGRYLRDCLEAISTASRSSYVLDRVVVVDNGSTDDSLAGLDDVRCRSSSFATAPIGALRLPAIKRRARATEPSSCS